MILAKMKNLRRERGLTQKAVAEKVGVSRGLISMVEGGNVLPYPSLRKRIARALGVNVADIWPESAGHNEEETSDER